LSVELSGVIASWRMKIVLAFVVLWLTVGASGQQSHESTGEIHGTVVGPDGQSAKGMLLSAVMECPSICSFWMTQTVTNKDGEYRFQHLPLGQKYSVFADNTKAGYPRFGPAPAGAVELTASHPDAELRVDLPPKVGVLVIHLSNKTTGAIIPRGLVKVKVLDAPDSRWSEVWADSSNCLFFPDCAISVPPDKQLLVHVSSAGFREWDKSAGKGKPFLVHSGARLNWDIQLEPLPQ
jgi:hypothetical protein